MRAGTVKGAGGTFLIDESLLPQLAFVREGEFSEVKGKPTLKLIGSLETIGRKSVLSRGKPQVVKVTGIRSTDILQAYLHSKVLPDPRGYLVQIAYETSAFLPFYFLLKQARLSRDEAKSIINKEQSTQSAKNKLLERITSDAKLVVPVPSNANPAGIRKLKVRQLLLHRSLPADITGQATSDLLDVIRTLKQKEADEGYLKDVLLKILNKNYASGTQAMNDKIRRATCYLDWLFNHDKILIDW